MQLAGEAGDSQAGAGGQGGEASAGSRRPGQHLHLPAGKEASPVPACSAPPLL